jgi:hypothetical protein
LNRKDVEIELNIANTFYDNDNMQYNTIAEIPGTDKKDEVCDGRRASRLVAHRHGRLTTGRERS